MALLDWIIIGLMIYFLASGFLKGFKKMFFGKIVKIGALIAAFFFSSRVASWIEEYTSLGVKIYDTLGNFGKYALLAIAYIIIVLVILILFKILGMFLKDKDGVEKKKSVVDRIFGLVLGFVKGVVTVEFLFIVAILLTKIPFLEGHINGFFATNNILDESGVLIEDGFSICKLFYKYAHVVIDFLFTQIAQPEEIALLAI